MALTIGYLVVLCIATLDFYYHMYVNKEKKTLIYTPFDYISGHYGYFYEEEPVQEKAETQKVRKINEHSFS